MLSFHLKISQFAQKTGDRLLERDEAEALAQLEALQPTILSDLTKIIDAELEDGLLVELVAIVWQTWCTN